MGFNSTLIYTSELILCFTILDIRVRLFGEEHPDTAKSYLDLGVTQHALDDFLSALKSKQRALDIRVKLFGEEHPDSAKSYFSLGVTQHALGDFLGIAVISPTSGFAGVAFAGVFGRLAGAVSRLAGVLLVTSPTPNI